MAFRMKLSGQESRQLQTLAAARRRLMEEGPWARSSPPPPPLGCPGLSLRVSRVEPLPQGLCLCLSRPDGAPLPAFAPGQCVSLLLPQGPRRLNRPFALCGTAEQARRGSYFITLPGREDDLAEALQELSQSGRLLTVSAPWGDLCFQPARCGRAPLALAEGDGLLSFISLARTVAEEEGDISLTLLACHGREQDFFYRQELLRLAEGCPRLHIEWLLAPDPQGRPGPLSFERLADLLEPEPSSLLISGSRGFYLHLESLLQQLAQAGRPLPPLLRQTLPPPAQPWLLPDYPAEERDRVFSLTLRRWEESVALEARAWETVLAALERAGVAAPARCRGGECGFCRARLLRGEVYLPPDCGEPCAADLRAGYIHPCCCYPLSDLELEINGEPVLAAARMAD